MGKVKPVDKRALLRAFRGKRVYVDPKKGTVSAKPTADSIPIPKTTWF